MKWNGPCSWTDTLCSYISECWRSETFIDAYVTNGNVKYPAHRLVLASCLPRIREYILHHDCSEEPLEVVFLGWEDQVLRDLVVTMYADDELPEEKEVPNSLPQSIVKNKEIQVVHNVSSKMPKSIESLPWTLSIIQDSTEKSSLSLDALRERAKEMRPKDEAEKPKEIKLEIDLVLDDSFLDDVGPEDVDAETEGIEERPKKQKRRVKKRKHEYRDEESSDEFIERSPRKRGRPAKNPGSKSTYKLQTSPVCSICKEDCKTAVEMFKHKAAKHTQEDPHPDRLNCPSCEMVFKETYQKRIHLTKHSMVGWICHFCKKGFRVPATLRDHLTLHTGNRDFCCQFCSKTFARRQNLEIHENTTHKKILNYSCKYCPKKFSGTTNLRRHENSHTGHKPYVCDICGKAFGGASTLRTHKLIHLGPGVGPYSCDYCKMQFKYNQVRKKHMLKCRNQYGTFE